MKSSILTHDYIVKGSILDKNIFSKTLTKYFCHLKIKNGKTKGKLEQTACSHWDMKVKCCSCINHDVAGTTPTWVAKLWHHNNVIGQLQRRSVSNSHYDANMTKIRSTIATPAREHFGKHSLFAKGWILCSECQVVNAGGENDATGNRC